MLWVIAEIVVVKLDLIKEEKITLFCSVITSSRE